MNDHDRAIGRLLLQRGLVAQDALRQAGERTDQIRAGGPYVELLKVLVDMQILPVDVARSIWGQVGADPNAHPVQRPAMAAVPPGAMPPLPMTLDPDAGFGGPGPNGLGGIPKTLDPDGPQPGLGFGGGGIPKTLDPDGPGLGFGGGGIPKTLDPDGPGLGFGGGGIPKTLDPDGPAFGGPGPVYDPDGPTLFQPGPDQGEPPLGLESFERNPADTAAGSGFAVPAFNPAGFGAGGVGDFGGPAGAGLGGGAAGTGFGADFGEPGSSDFSPVADTGFGGPESAFGGPESGFGGPGGSGFGTGFGGPESGFGGPASGFGGPGGSAFGGPPSGFGGPGGSAFGGPPSGFGLPSEAPGGFGQAPPSGIEQSMGSTTKVPGAKSGKVGRAPSRRAKGVSGRRAERTASGRKSISERAGARSSARVAGQGSGKTAATLVGILVVSVVVIGGVLYGLNSGKTPPPVDPNAHVDPGEGDGGGDGGGAIDDGGAVVVDHGDGKLEWHGHRYTTPKTPEEVEATASRLAEKAIGDAKDFVFDGQYQKAIELLESFPEDLQKGSAFSEVTSELALYKRYQVYKEKLDTTLKGDREALKSMVKRILSQDLPPELQELECNGPFLVEARNILGVEEFGKLEVGEVTEDQ